MKRAFFIIATCLVMAGCGPAEGEKPKQTGKEFMKGFGECANCGKTKHAYPVNTDTHYS